MLEDVDLMAEYRTLLDDFDRYMENGAGHWFERQHGDELDGPVAYFCAEYGLHESLGIYSGGLGVLAGDHLQGRLGHGPAVRRPSACSTATATSARRSTPTATRSTPTPTSTRRGCRCCASPTRTASRCRVGVELPGRTVWCAVWLAQVGRVPLLLLDTDIPDNDDHDRPITHILYVRGREMRLHQEIVLGVGGVRALRALGIKPARGTSTRATRRSCSSSGRAS